MADIDSLNIKIESDSTSAASGLDKLSASLNNLKTALGGIRIGPISNALSKLSQALSGFDATKGVAIQSIAASLSQLGQATTGMRISPTLGANIASLNTSLSGLQAIDPATIEPIAAALQAMSTAMGAITGIGNVGGLADIASAINSMATADMRGVAVNIGRLRDQLEQLNGIDASGLQNVANASQMINASDMGAFAQNVTAMAAAIRELAMNAQVSAGGGAIADLINSITSAAANISDDQIRKLEALANAAQTLSSASGNVQMPNLGGSVSDAMSNATRQASGSASGFMSILKGMGGAATSAFGKFPALVSAAGNAIDGLKKKLNIANTAVGGFLKSLARVAKMRMLRGIIKGITSGISEGLKNLANSSAAANATLGQFSSGTAYLKNSLASALYPAIAACVGAFNTLISVVVAALNAISMLFAVLGGKTSFTKATRGANEFGTAAGGAAGGAAALKQELMGFDEINSLSPAGGGGGGGGGGGISTGVFETALIPEEIANMIKSGDFTQIGKDIANKINEALASIDWGSIKSKAKWVAKALTTLINGFIQEIDTVLLGTSLGEAFNTVLTFALDFWKGIDWSLMGKKIGEGLIALFDTIDPVLLAAKMIAKFMAIRDFLVAFFATNPFQKIAEFFNAAIGEIFESADFEPEQIAKDLAYIVNSAIDSLWTFVNPDTGKLKVMAVRIAGFIRSAFRELPTTIGKLASVTSAIVEKITEACEDVNLGKEAADALCDSVIAILDSFSLPDATSTMTHIALQIVAFITECINKAPALLGKFTNFVAKVGLAIGKAIQDQLKDVTPGSVITGIKEAVVSLFENIDIDELKIGIKSLDLNAAAGAATAMGALLIALSKFLPGVKSLSWKNGVTIGFGILAAVEVAVQVSDIAEAEGAGSKAEASLQLIGSLLTGVLFGAVGAQFLGVVGGTMGFSFGVTLFPKIQSVVNDTAGDAVSIGAIGAGYLGVGAEIAMAFQNMGTTIAAAQSAIKSQLGLELTAEEILGISGLDLSTTAAEFTSQGNTVITAFQNLFLGLGDAVSSGISPEEYLASVGIITDANDNLASGTAVAALAVAMMAQGMDNSLTQMFSATDELTTEVDTFSQNATEAATAATGLQTVADQGVSFDQWGMEAVLDEAKNSADDLSTALIDVEDVTIETDGIDSFDTALVTADEDAKTLGSAIIEIPTEKNIVFTLKNASSIITTLNNIKDALDGIGGKSVSISVKAGLTGSSASFLRTLRGMSSGSLNTSITNLLNLSAFARGGFPKNGQIFIANEAGPEMVGKIGNQSAVANEMQIGEAIFKYMDEHDAQNGGGFNESSFANAMVRAMKAAGIGMVSLDGRMLANSINRETQRSGKPAIQF